jgi:hypothetical protein
MSRIGTLSRALLFLLPLFLLLLPGTQALAAAVSVTYCVDYEIDYDDGSTGDYLTGATTKARGALLRFDDDGTLTDVYLDWDGANPGCVTTTLDNATSYAVKLVRKAHVNGNTLKVVDDDATPALYASTITSSHTPVANTTYDWDVGPTNSIRILAAATWAIQRRTGGISGETFRFITEACPGTTTSCQSGSDLYIKPSHSDDKFIIAHELGHRMFELANEGLEDANDPEADLDGCNASGQADSYDPDGHKMNSKEWTAQAYVEGVAHFYSAIAFNADNTETDCDIQKHYRIDWDADGIFQPLESSIFSCEGSPDADVDTYDYTGDFCIAAGATDNRSTEYDVLRFLWDLTKQGVSLATIFAVWDEADPDDWYVNGTGTGGDFPAARLDAAADTVGGTTDLHFYWAWWAYVNGADR